jgi:hypothetical protein
VIPNDDPATNSTQKNKYFAQKAIDVYTELAPIVFTKYDMSPEWKYGGTAIFLAVGLIIGFLAGVRAYHNPDYEENTKVLKMMIKNRKRTIKGKDHGEGNKNLSQMLAKSLAIKIMDKD